METPVQSTQDSLFNIRILLTGDVMLGRLVDQIMPDHVENSEEQKLSWKLLEVRAPHRIPLVKKEPYKYIWSDCMPLFAKREHTDKQAEDSPIEPVDVNIINLETSVTTFPKKFPNKAFNYRMHPRNLKILKEAHIDYCSIANNHVLDYCEEGLEDTVNSLHNIGIKFAGAGINLDEAQKPAVLHARGKTILCFSFSDHYDYWAATSNKPGINFIDVLNYTQKDISRIKELIEHYKSAEQADMVIFSIHWGANYCWNPPKQFQQFAHDLVDTCHVDVLHGHSAHHIQGIEIYKGKPILYGCGDFVDDYAVDDDYRNDLGFLYVLTLDANATVKKIELVPTKIELFSVTMTPPSKERNWLITNMSQLCSKFGTVVTPQQNSNVLLVSNVHN